MGRTRAKKTPASKAPAAPPQTAALLEKAQALIVQCDYELAARFAKRILESEPDNADAREILGVSLLESDDIDGAKQVCVCIPPSPERDLIPPLPSGFYITVIPHANAAIGAFVSGTIV